MRKIVKKLKHEDVGSIGIGAMIVFIAMVLVAGIAASVLIQTSTRLETQAMRSGAETIDEVATGINVVAIEGHYSSGAGYVDLIVIEITPRAGSSDVDLSETIIEISDSATKSFLTYSSVAAHFTDTQWIDGEIFTYANFTNTSTEFSIIVIEDADSSCSQSTPVINRGDLVALGINASQCFSGLANRKDIFGMVFSEQGSAGIITFTSPPSYSDEVLELQ